jgi:hypothetical protein
MAEIASDQIRNPLFQQRLPGFLAAAPKLDSDKIAALPNDIQPVKVTQMFSYP